MKTLFIALFSTFLIGTASLNVPSTLTTERPDKECKCSHKGQQYSVGSEVCMEGLKKECKKNSENKCEWLDVGEKCKK